MPLDGVTAKCLASELNSLLADARLDRVFQPDRHDIILQFRQGSENYRLILSANPSAPRLHITTETRENPSEPPMFCMLLRKHLVGSRLLSISTPGYERIFELRFSTVNEIGDKLEKRLVVEIMGRHSNIILLNHENRIHDAILHIDQSISRVREIMPARTYVLPPDQKKLAPEDALAALNEGRDWLNPAAGMLALDKAILEALQGFSPLLSREAVYLAGLDARQKPAQLDALQRKSLDAALRQMLTGIIAGQFKPTTYYDTPQAIIPIDFHALKLHALFIQKSAASVSQAMDLFYLERSRQNTLRQKKQGLEKIISSKLEHARKKLQIHEADLLESENRDQLRIYGELILAGIGQGSESKTEFLTTDYYQEDQPTIAIPLQSGLSLSQNAQRYFKLYAKARTRYENGCRFAFEDQQEILWLETLQNALLMANEADDLAAVRQEIVEAGLLGEKYVSSSKGSPAVSQQPGKPGSRKSRQAKNFQKSKQSSGKKGAPRPVALLPRQYVSSDGLTIQVGRNNLQNDQLTLKTAQKDDIWLHVQKMPGTHVIIRANRQSVPDQTLLEAAEIAAWFSKATAAAGSGQQKVAVDYCPVSHVRKPAGARPGMVIYDRYQTLMVVPKLPQDPA